jgi:divalent metal cation (Fe/Co/Zn/Cd) transporter
MRATLPRATIAEGTQNGLCAATGAGVLAGLVADAAFGAWWLDPVLGLVTAAAAAHRGRAAWSGGDCR